MKQLEIQKHIASLTNEELEAFILELNMITLLTIEEELELIHRIRKGGSEADQAKEMLVRSYLRFIYSVAKKYKRLSLQELLVSGITGLIKAADRYDETRGFKFISYAVWWIRQSMLKSIVKHGTKDKQTELIVLFSKRQMLCIQKDENIDPYVDNGLTALAASNKDEEVFLKNAHLFYRNADHILADSRMFFAPVLIQNGMTY
ncbi:MAG: sigma-70 family RNA polymerase sigma factor, partial [Bacteroidaceae bacterium]|nr:sigma-70 family RNA polymerase sigma factor [Bacteroidaceae bacterium]